VRLVAFVAPLVLLAGCGSGRTADILSAVGSSDAGVDVFADVVAADVAVDVAFGAKACVDNGQCDDGLPCTFDRCDLGKCVNIPDDTRCDDGIYCNGREVCLVRRGCAPGPVVTCSEGDPCLFVRCLEETKSCERVPRDADGDGDPDDHCGSGHDCNDLDPTVASTVSEICGNSRDDNCNGKIDETPCVQPKGDICSDAVVAPIGQTTSLSTAGARRDYAASCGVSTPEVSRDVVATVTIGDGPSRDLEVWATAGAEVALALQQRCGETELACGASRLSTARLLGRSLPPGDYTVLVSTQGETAVELRPVLLDATTKPTNETCETAVPIVPGVLTTVKLIDATKDLTSACAALTGELTYALTLAERSDVRVLASTALGTGTAVVGLRTCPGSELRCRTGGTLLARSLEAGTYVITVAATGPIDANILVQVGPPTVAPADQSCATAPLLSAGVTVPIVLAEHESSIAASCFSGAPSAAVALGLDQVSDVLLVARFPSIDMGAIALAQESCGAEDRIACSADMGPARVNRRGVAAGDYRVVVSDTNGLDATLTAYVRAAVPPTLVDGADRCSSLIVDIPSTGGFFTGDTSKAAADFDTGCNIATGDGGAPDQILRLVLPGPRRVLLDMSGSTYWTALEVRKGATCPGVVVPGACQVGFSPGRSFLERDLAAGTYWLVVDGWDRQAGVWNLDVRVVE
jgi:hypothetical protein